MLRSESYKLFIKQKMWILILVFFVAKICSVVIEGYDSTYMIDGNEKYYVEYLEKYGGKVSEEKSKEIEKEYEELQFDSENELLIHEQKYMAFQVVYNQYVFQRDKGCGYVFDTRGWQSIFEHDSMDFLLVLCIIIIVTELWGNEYEKDMQIILWTCKNGKHKVPAAKTCMGIISSIIISVLFQLIKIVYLAGTVGLKHGNYPLQSLEFFQKYEYDISITSALVIVFIFRIAGAILLSLFAGLICIAIKKKTISLITTSAFMLLSVIVFRSENVLYYLPLPCGPIIGVGYIWPSRYESTFVDGENVYQCIFHGIPMNNMKLMLVLFVLEIIILSIICVFLFSKAIKINFLSKIMNKKKVALSIILLSFVVSGCGSAQKDMSENTIFIGKDDTQGKADWSGGTIAIDNENTNILYTDRDGNEEELIKDVFDTDIKISKIFVWDDYCYYLLEDKENDGICIKRMNLKNYDIKTIYSSLDKNIEDFYGIVEEKRDINDMMNSFEDIKWFFVTDEDIYYKKRYSITKINIQSGKKSTLVTGVADDDITYKNKKIYYSDANGNSENVQCK